MKFCTKNDDSVVHIAIEGYNYGEEDDEDEVTFEEKLATSVPGPNNTTVFNLEIENELKKVRKVVKTFRKGSVKNEIL